MMPLMVSVTCSCRLVCMIQISTGICELTFESCECTASPTGEQAKHTSCVE